MPPRYLCQLQAQLTRALSLPEKVQVPGGGGRVDRCRDPRGQGNTSPLRTDFSYCNRGFVKVSDLLQFLPRYL